MRGGFPTWSRARHLDRKLNVNVRGGLLLRQQNGAESRRNRTVGGSYVVAGTPNIHYDRESELLEQRWGT